MAKSRVNSKNKLSKKSKSNAPKWLIAGVVVLVVAVAGYAIVRFSQAGSENIGDRLRIRYPKQTGFTCPSTATGKSIGGTAYVVCGLSSRQHATGIWENYGSTGINFDSVYGGNRKGYVCARIGVAKGATVKLTIEKQGKSMDEAIGIANMQFRSSHIATAENTAATYFNSTSATQIKELCGAVDINTFLLDRLIGRLYAINGATAVEYFYLKND